MRTADDHWLPALCYYVSYADCVSPGQKRDPACRVVCGRNDQGYWKQLESFIQSHSEATFSHCICPECLHQLYPALEQRVLERAARKERQRAE